MRPYRCCYFHRLGLTTTPRAFLGSVPLLHSLGIVLVCVVLGVVVIEGCLAGASCLGQLLQVGEDVLLAPLALGVERHPKGNVGEVNVLQ